MTYAIERVSKMGFESRLHRMAVTGERLVAFCLHTDGTYELVIDPPHVAPKAPELPPKAETPALPPKPEDPKK